MPETTLRSPGTAVSGGRPPAPSASALPAPALRPGVAAASPRPHRFHSRIGVGLAGGFYPAPHRYDLYLSAGCPRSLRVSITLDLLGLGGSVATTLLTRPAGTPEALAALRGAYEATVHHYDGPLTVPALRDRWSGRIVSNETPAILRDLGGLLPGDDGARHRALNPPALAPEIDALRDLLDRDVTPAGPPSERSAALGLLDRRLASGTHALGDTLTAADVDLWVALVHLGPAGTLCSYPRLGAYVRRLGAHPAFRDRTGAVPDAA
ncbi:glutathione S-transferase C-terminal domain-containing protein [Streptomyces sp. NPDC127033]|uniref:glutathione S-transferase C-terminal domain-containing protein n=1 Tax=Streptomyces sp. NPDC127033 TaxID=3347110 RepID=UPI003653DCB3